MSNRGNTIRSVLISIASIAIIVGAGMYIHDWVKKNSKEDGRKKRANTGPIQTSPGDPSKCTKNMSIAGIALQQYAIEHDWMLPRKVSELYPDFSSTPLLLVCPGTNDTFDRTKPVDEVRRKIDSSEAYKVFPLVRGNSPDHWIMCYCDSDHRKGDVIVCMVNGRYSRLSREEFNRARKRQMNEMSRTR